MAKVASEGGHGDNTVFNLTAKALKDYLLLVSTYINADKAVYPFRLKGKSEVCFVGAVAIDNTVYNLTCAKLLNKLKCSVKHLAAASRVKLLVIT